MSQNRCSKPKSAKPAKTRLPSQLNVPPPAPAPRDTFQVVIQCDSETEQEALYNEFRSRGMTVRLLTM